MRNISISLRLTLWFSAVIVCGFTLFGIVMWADLAYSLSKGRDRTLVRRAMRAVEVLSNAPPGAQVQRYEAFASGTPEGELIRVYDVAGRLLYPKSNLSPADFPWPPPASTHADRFLDIVFRKRPYRALQHFADLGSLPIVVVVGGQLEDNRQMLARFSAGLMAAIPAFLIASAIGGYFMSRRVLQPVNRIAAAMRTISIGNLSDRLPVSENGDELARLAETSNQMMARLESAVAQIKRFTADASHELRSPLSYIRTVAEFAVRDPDLSADSREAFEGILAESEEASRLLEDMLLLARADAGHVDIQFEPVDLAVLVRDVCEKARVPSEAKGHQLVVQCTEGKCEIRGDRTSLRRLIWTLLDNAIKYTPDGGRVSLRVERANRQIRLSVQDTGMGIPEHLLPRIFERFFRADPVRTQGDGAGLGLAIAKWIADVHQAALSVKTEVGVGSEFSVVFPPEHAGL